MFNKIVGVIRARFSVIHVRDTPNTKTYNSLSRSVHVFAQPDFPIRNNKKVDASRQAKKIKHYHQQIDIKVLLKNHLRGIKKSKQSLFRGTLMNSF